MSMCINTYLSRENVKGRKERGGGARSGGNREGKVASRSRDSFEDFEGKKEWKRNPEGEVQAAAARRSVFFGQRCGRRALWPSVGWIQQWWRSMVEESMQEERTRKYTS